MKDGKDTLIVAFSMVVLMILSVLNLSFGPESIPFGDVLSILTGGDGDNVSWSYTIENRLNRTLLAIASGGALALAGIILQVYFRNPLAGPGVLGISSGASLGVAAVVLGGVGVGTVLGNIGMIMAGIAGAFLVLFLLLAVSRFIANAVTLLVVGLMFGYFTSALINILFQLANQADTRSYVIWTLGSFDAVKGNGGWWYFAGIILVAVLTIFLIKPLNALVLGTAYASSSGIELGRTKVLIIGLTGLLTAIVTVYCGPVGFIGIAVPQLVRIIIRTTNHRLLLPATFILGSSLAVLADLIVRLSHNSLPLNTVTALIGAPVIIWTIITLNRRAEI